MVKKHRSEGQEMRVAPGPGLLIMVFAMLVLICWSPGAAQAAATTPAGDASLSGLYLSAGTLSPVFSPDVTSYTSQTSSYNIQVKAVVMNSSAQITLNGSSLPSGLWSANLSLNNGTNAVTVKVTVPNGSSQSYNITVIRPGEKDKDANLMSLALQDSALTPAFSSAITSYTSSNSNFTTAVMAMSVDSNAIIRLNNGSITAGQWVPINLETGLNTFTILVISKDGTTTKTYTITVTGPNEAASFSHDAFLHRIMLSNRALDDFSATDSAYTEGVSNETAILASMELEPQESHAIITVNGAKGVRRLTSIPLNVGDNIFTIVVTAQDGTTTKTYTLNVIRAGVPLPAPVVTSISPASGPESGYTKVTISGSRFTGALGVLFGRVPASGLTIENDTTITAFSPPGTGTEDVTIVGPNTSSEITSEDRFTYFQSSPGSTSDQTILRFYIGSKNYVSDQVRSMDTAPAIINGRTMLPISYVATALGAGVEWNALQQKVSITLNGKIVELVIGKNAAWANGANVAIDPNNPDVAPIIAGSGRTMLPISFIAQNLGCKVDWDQAQQMVTITYPAP